MTRHAHWPAVLFAAVGIAVALLSTADLGLMLDGFVYGGYYAMFAGLLLWVAILARVWRRQRAAIVAGIVRHRVGLLLSVALCGLLVSVVPQQFRVLADETNLVSISRSLAFERRADNVIEGYRYYGDAFHPERRVAGKRPLLYPYLVAVTHTLTGYRPANAFAVNAVALLAVLVVGYLAAARFVGRRWGWVAVLLLASQPQLALSATSAGLEPLYLALLCLTFVALHGYLEAPSGERLLLLWIHAVLLLGTRYEALVVVAVLVAGVAVARRPALATLRQDAWYYAATPWLLLPLFWQRFLMLGAFELPEGKVSAAFSFEFATSNGLEYLRHFSDVSFRLPFATAVELFGLVAAGAFGVLFVARQVCRGSARRWLIAMVAAVLLALGLLTLFYYHGRITSPYSSRLFLPFSVALTLAATWGLARLPRGALSPAGGLVIALGALLLYLPIAVDDRFHRQTPLLREYRFGAEFLASVDRDLLLIHDRPGMFLVDGVGAIHFNRANGRPDEVLGRLRQRLFREIYVLQRIDPASGRSQPATRLDPVYRLETVRERLNGQDELLRISRVRHPESG